MVFVLVLSCQDLVHLYFFGEKEDHILSLAKEPEISAGSFLGLLAEIARNDCLFFKKSIFIFFKSLSQKILISFYIYYLFILAVLVSVAACRI